MRLLRNIKVRLTLSYLVILALLVAFSGTVAYLLLLRGLSLRAAYPWDTSVVRIERTTDGAVHVGDFTTLFDLEALRQAPLSVRGYKADDLLRQASQNEAIIFGTADGPVAVDASLLVKPGAREDDQTWLYFYPVSDKPGTYELLVVSQSLADREGIVALFRNAILTAGTITLIVAGLIGFFLVWRMLRPLQTITQVARGIGGKDFKSRLKVDRNDELGELASALNQAFDRVETAIDAERQVVSDLSHELRMPLAIAQSEATQLLMKETTDKEYQKALETVSREISHLSSVTSRLLFLARSENGKGLVMRDLDLRALVKEMASDAEVLCEGKGLTLKSDLFQVPDGLPIVGDAVRLRELFLNLMDNAIRYTPAGGTISLSLGREGLTGGDGFGKLTTGACATVTVSDTGIGIPEEHIPRLFERFYRAGRPTGDQSGTGLGLAICKRIAELHGGRIEVKSKLGEGSTFTVTLPLKENRPDSTAATQQPLRQPSG